MGTPYATIILPTHDRHATLPVAIRSALDQSVREIEILLVLDGATQACRELAEEAARGDPRVRILDLPKAPGSGAANVERAIEVARAGRIFYSDDDDILLRDHIATLGPLLNLADIAESRVATASRELDLHLAPSPTAHPAMRRLLAEYQLKTLFDTHLAHWVDSFRRFTRWVPEGGPSRRPVWEFLRGFAAASDCRWAATESFTALSLHGANRRDMTSEARAAEIAHWRGITCDSSAWHAVCAAATSHCHLDRLLAASPPLDQEGFEAYLARHGAYGDVYSDGTCRDLFALATGTKLPLLQAREVVRRLTTQSFVGCWPPHVAGRLARVYGPRDVDAILASLRVESGGHYAGTLAVLSFLSVQRGDQEGALAAIEEAAATGPDPLGHFAAERNRLRAATAKKD